MISQSCPRCGSRRIRRGYRVTPWWQKIFGRYSLLCNDCNWEFVGFALPGTVSKPRRSSDSSGQHGTRKTTNFLIQQNNGKVSNNTDNLISESKNLNGVRIKKKRE